MARFFLDNDVPTSVGRMLGSHGHTWSTANQAHMAEDRDDDLTVYAIERQAVLVTFDREFSQRRRRASVGHHVQMRCDEPEAAALLESVLDKVLDLLRGRDHVTIQVSKSGVESSSAWE